MNSSNNLQKANSSDNNQSSSFTQGNTNNLNPDEKNLQDYTKYFQSRNSLSMAANGKFTRNNLANKSTNPKLEINEDPIK